MKAWYFSNTDKKLRYGDDRIIEAGKMHTVRGEPKLCEYGLHASERIIDALKYSPGSYIWRVDVTRKVVAGADKVCGQRRKYLWGYDAEKVLREFARKQALINIEKIKPYTDKYDLIYEYLLTGGEGIQDAANSAACAAAGSAARSAACAAAWAAACAAARDAAGSAARSAAEYAARDAADALLSNMVTAEAKHLGFNVED